MEEELKDPENQNLTAHSSEEEKPEISAVSEPETAAAETQIEVTDEPSSEPAIEITAQEAPTVETESQIQAEEVSAIEAPAENEVETTVVPGDEKITIIAETSHKPESADKVSKTGHKRIMQGKVSSNKPDKTIIVAIVRQVAHPLYKKYYKRTKKFMAHDANNECNVGDVVKIRESRPLSARKRWELIEIVQRAK
ncbi:MAG: small subunit ribosomal protein, partial [Bacteroidota bacterium]|nr:small subunit ribosomal protein [Bacteroidota bacterium]